MIVFRCDAGPNVGFGHLIRCRTLAAALKARGADCAMIGPDDAYASTGDETIFSHWHPVPDWPGEATDADFLTAWARKFRARAAVLDDYRVGAAYQRVVRSAGLRWLQFEARPDRRLWADLVLNASPAARPEDYAGRLHTSHTRLLLGPEYAILRPEFSALPPRSGRRTLRNILLTFGAGDDRGAIRLTLEALLPAMPEDVGLTVVSGRHNPNNALGTWVAEHGADRVRLLVDPPDMAAVMANCDLAVMAGGTTTFEAVRSGLPMVLIATADNQVSQAQAWAERGAAVYLGPLPDIEPEDIVEGVWQQHQHGQPDISVNGQGAAAVSAALLETVAAEP